MKEFHGIARGGNMELPITQLRLRESYLASLKDGTKIVEKLQIEGKSKTNQQVKAHFGLIVALIRDKMDELGWDICGVLPNKIMIHEILKKSCGGVGDDGELISMRDMTVKQAMEFFDNCRKWAATQLFLDIPNPDPNWKEST